MSVVTFPTTAAQPSTTTHGFHPAWSRGFSEGADSRGARPGRADIGLDLVEHWCCLLLDALSLDRLGS